MVQLIGTVSLAVGALSFGGQFNVMVVADAAGYPDIEVFVGSAAEELHALAA